MARAWALKETAMALLLHLRETWSHAFLLVDESGARSRLEPIKHLAGILKRRFEKIATRLCHRINNAGSESLNAKIQRLKRTATDFATGRISSTPTTSTAVDST